MPFGSQQGGYEGPGFRKKRRARRRAPSPSQAVQGFARSTTQATRTVTRSATKPARRKVRRKPTPSVNTVRGAQGSPKVTRQAKRSARRSRDVANALKFLRQSAGHRTTLAKAGIGGGALPDVSGFLKSGGGLALDILEETTRPVHGIAGSAREALRGGSYKDQQKAFVRGVENKDKYLFSDVLKEAGAPKWLQTGGGFALDVAADPTTYLTGGTASVGKKLAVKEATRVYEKGVAKGMSEHGARTVAQRAGKRKLAEVQKAGKDNRGLTLGVGRHRTSGKTTAAISRAAGIPKVARKARRTKAVQVGGQNLRPGFRPAGAAPEAFETVRAAERQHRAARALGERHAQQRAVAYAKRLTKKDHAKVIDALESGKLRHLDDNLRPVARRMRDDYRHMLRKERQAGIAGGEVRDYFPHIPAHTMEPGAAKPRASAANLASSKTRKVKKTIKQLRDEDPSLFSEDVPLVFGARASASARGVSKAEYLKAVAKSGRKLTPDTVIDTATEAAYRVTPKQIRRVEWKDALNAVERGQSGYMVLNKAVADRALKGTTTKEGPAAELGRWYDRKMQGPVKTILTVPNPQYHFTNLYGDLFNAYLADTGVRSLTHSLRAQARLARREAARKTLGKQLDPLDRGVKIGGRKVRYDELIVEAEENGAIRTGFIGRDLPDVLDAQGKELAEKLGKGRVGRRLGPKGQKALRSRTAQALTHPIDAIRNMSQYREDFVRLGTYIEARKNGLSPIKAAERVAKFHFDYGDLTEFERNVLRRVFPFYTFTARNVPLQAERLIARPGKAAALQKAREEFAKAAGLEPGWEDKLEDYEQRGLPLPLPVKDNLGNTMLLYPKLPAMDLGRLTLNPTEQARYLAAMTTPLLKSPFELLFDYNLFFGEPISNKDAPLVPAPDDIGSLPQALRNKLGVRKYRDKKTGKMIWGWPGKVDYVARLTPASATGLQLGTDARTRQGQDSLLKLGGYLTGLKVTPFDKTRAALNQAFERRTELEERMSALRQQDRSKRKDGSYRPEYRRLLDENRKLGDRVYRLKKKAGYKILPTAGAPKDKTPLDRIDSALGRSGGDTGAFDRIDRALGAPRGGDALDRIEKALAR